MFFFVKQKTAYEMRISDWSSDVCSSDLIRPEPEIGAEDVAVRRPLAHQPYEVPCDPDEGLVQAVGFRRPDPFVVVEEDQVDIARIVQFVCAELAHAEHDQTAVRGRLAFTLQIGRTSCRESVCQSV